MSVIPQDESPQSFYAEMEQLLHDKRLLHKQKRHLQAKVSVPLHCSASGGYLLPQAVLSPSPPNKPTQSWQHMQVPLMLDTPDTFMMFDTALVRTDNCVVFLLQVTTLQYQVSMLLADGKGREAQGDERIAALETVITRLQTTVADVGATAARVAGENKMLLTENIQLSAERQQDLAKMQELKVSSQHKVPLAPSHTLAFSRFTRNHLSLQCQGQQS